MLYLLCFSENVIRKLSKNTPMGANILQNANAHANARHKKVNISTLNRVSKTGKKISTS